MSLTLNDRGLGFELNGVSLILTGIAKCIGESLPRKKVNNAPMVCVP